VGRRVLGGMKIITLNLEEKDDMTTTMTMILHLFGEQEKP
jgi:hypothetical protein